MPFAASLSRAWILLVLLAVIAYAACATGAAPCAIAKPVGLSASLLAAALVMLAPEGDRGAEDERERGAASKRI